MNQKVELLMVNRLMKQNDTMKKVLLFILLIVAYNSYSQDFEADMTKVFENIKSSESVSISVDVTLYAKKGGSVVYSAKSSLFHEEGRTISKLGEMEIYKSDKYEIQVDHEEKLMLIHPINKNQQEYSSIELEELKKLVSQEKGHDLSYELISNDKGLKTYRSKKVKGFDEVTFIINMNELKIVKVTYQYRESSNTKSNYCTLNYTQFDFNNQFPKDFFDLSKYFKIVDEKYILNNKFSNYNLIVR